jgi:hypothetical protein
VKENKEIDKIMIEEKTAERKSMVGFILGLASIILCLTPLFGFPITITGLVYSIKEMKGEKRSFAIAGLVLNTIFLILTISIFSLSYYWLTK